MESIKSEYIEILSEKVKKSSIIDDIGEDVLIDFKSCMIDLFLSDYYSDCYEGEFHKHLLDIYLSGHLPCGWNGKYPQGKFMVY